MLDPLKFYDRCDKNDPRLSPVPADCERSPMEILKRRKQDVELLLSICDDDDGNRCRAKAQSVHRAIDRAIEDMRNGFAELAECEPARSILD